MGCPGWASLASLPSWVTCYQTWADSTMPFSVLTPLSPKLSSHYKETGLEPLFYFCFAETKFLCALHWFRGMSACELWLSFELLTLSLWPQQYHGHVCVPVCLSSVVCRHVGRGTWCLAFVYAAACLSVHGTGVWKSKERGMMGRSLGLVIQFSPSGCKARKCTEIELLGKLPGKSLFQCRNSASNATPILGGGSGWLGSLPWNLPILYHFFILTLTALVLALVLPHHSGHPGQSTCPDSLWFIQHHFIVDTDHFLRTDAASLLLQNPVLTPRPHLASKALQHCHLTLQTSEGPEGQSCFTTSGWSHLESSLQLVYICYFITHLKHCSKKPS